MPSMLELLTLLIPGVFIILFARFATEEPDDLQDTRVFQFVPRLLKKIKPLSIRVYIMKPICGCTYCMASVWGSFTYFVGFSANWIEFNLIEWPVYCMMLCGVMVFLGSLFDFGFSDVIYKTDIEIDAEEGQVVKLSYMGTAYANIAA